MQLLELVVIFLKIQDFYCYVGFNFLTCLPTKTTPCVDYNQVISGLNHLCLDPLSWAQVFACL